MSEWQMPKLRSAICGSAGYCPNCSEPWTIKCLPCKASPRFWKPHKFCPDCRAPIEKLINLRNKQMVSQGAELKVTP